jgi:hypothetical protein
MALGSAQYLTELSTRNLPGVKGRPGRKANDLTEIYEPIVWKNVGASTTRNLMGLHDLLQGQLYLTARKKQNLFCCRIKTHLPEETGT